MKQLLLIPIILLLSALLGYAALRGFGWRTWTHEMIAACVPCAIAGTLALVPALLQRPNGQAGVVQGAFHGMVIHMILPLALAGLVYLAAGPSRLANQPFALWAMWFFIVSLLSVSGALIRIIRSTPIGTGHSNSPATEH